MKNRRYFLKNGVLAGAALLVAQPFKKFGSSNLFFGAAGGDTITLLHTNDLHNQLTAVTHNSYADMGGFEKTARVIAGIQKEKSNVLLMDAGDIFCGDIAFQKEHGTTLQMMRSLQYDAALLGNRDYAAGTDYLQEQWQTNDVPLVASNYSYNNNWLSSVQQPYKIVQKGNIKIGIIGAGINTKGLVSSGINSMLEHKDPVKELTAVATMLKQKEKCQLVVCLSHLGYSNKNGTDDTGLAKQSKNIDVIVGAHSHTFMAAPVIAMNCDQQEVIINHAGHSGIALGNMNISFDADGNKSGVEFNNLMIGTPNNKWRHQRTAVALT